MSDSSSSDSSSSSEEKKKKKKKDKKKEKKKKDKKKDKKKKKDPGSGHAYGNLLSGSQWRDTSRACSAVGEGEEKEEGKEGPLLEDCSGEGPFRSPAAPHGHRHQQKAQEEEKEAPRQIHTRCFEAQERPAAHKTS